MSDKRAKEGNYTLKKEMTARWNLSTITFYLRSFLSRNATVATIESLEKRGQKQRGGRDLKRTWELHYTPKSGGKRPGKAKTVG